MPSTVSFNSIVISADSKGRSQTAGCREAAVRFERVCAVKIRPFRRCSQPSPSSIQHLALCDTESPRCCVVESVSDLVVVAEPLAQQGPLSTTVPCDVLDLISRIQLKPKPNTRQRK